VPPPSNSFAIELPASPVQQFSHPTAQASTVTLTGAPGEDSLPAHPTPHDSTLTLPVSPTRHSSSDVASFRPSHEYSRPPSQQQGSPGRSTEYISYHSISPPNDMPPPIPPKTPIPYPPTEDNGVSMPAPLFSQTHLPVASGKARPPYPVDEPPPVVNRQRKPSYHVR
jgi:hypothetical protein